MRRARGVVQPEPRPLPPVIRDGHIRDYPSLIALCGYYNRGGPGLIIDLRPRRPCEKCAALDIERHKARAAHVAARAERASLNAQAASLIASANAAPSVPIPAAPEPVPTMADTLADLLGIGDSSNYRAREAAHSDE